MRKLLLLLAGVLLAAGCNTSTPPKANTLHGTVQVTDDSVSFNPANDCAMTGGFEDVNSGTPVQVTNEKGDVVGVSTLGDGKVVNSITCSFPFTVTGVPQAKIYNVEVSQRGKVGYSLQQMKNQSWTISLKL